MRRLPNIILCTCDQLRAFEVACYGKWHIHTEPRLLAFGISL